MKKLVAALATVVAVAAVMAGAVLANPTSGKVVAEGFSCGVYDGNGSVFVTTNSVLTVYQNKAVLQCSGSSGAPAASLTYFNYGNTGASCGMLEFGSTTRSVQDEVGRNGSSQLQCTVDLSIDRASSAGGRRNRLVALNAR